jgi:hypothetical protein
VQETVTPEKKMCAAMLWQAANDYHSYYHAGLRRHRISTALRPLRKSLKHERAARAEAITERIKVRAGNALRWFNGCAAPIPFNLVAAAFGWHPELMAKQMMDGGVGDRLRERYGS